MRRLPELPDGLPTPRYMLAADCADVSLFCLACLHRSMADLDDLVRRGKGDMPLIRLRWKCRKCGSAERVSSAGRGRAPQAVMGPGARARARPPGAQQEKHTR